MMLWTVQRTFGRVQAQRAIANASLSFGQRRPRAFDITTNTKAHGARKDTAAWQLSGAFTRFDRRFEVFEVSKTGDLRRTSVTLGNVLRDFGVHARDVLSLGLQGERYHPPPAVLPRDGVVVIALGPFKALIHTEACLLFEAGNMDVLHIVPVLAELIQANAEPPVSEADGGMSRANARGSGRDDGGESKETGRPLRPTPPPKSSVRGDVCEVRQTGILAPRFPEDATPSLSSSAGDGDGGVDGPSGGFTGERRGGVAGGAGAPDSSAETDSRGIVSKLGEYAEALGFLGADDGGGGGEKEEEHAQEHQLKVMFREQRPMPFELAMLEVMLQEVCTSYHRRAHLIRRLMEQGLQPNDTTSVFAPNRIENYRVVPLKLALNQLELKLQQTRACLEELMHSDEDMLGLLLTEAKELQQGEILDPHRHSVVELLLENYHRQLVLVGHDVGAMKHEVESMQELAAISLDVSRNSMIAVDIRLAMLNLGVASCACVFGAMGMNVVNGMESSHVAFYALLGGSMAASVAAVGGVMRHMSSIARAGDSQQGRLMALNTICDHVEDIESVLRTGLGSRHSNSGATRPKGADDDMFRGVIDREDMATKLSRARGKEISGEELDLIFSLFDTSGDGAIDRKEYGKLVTDPAGSLGSKAAAAAKKTRRV